MIFGRNRPLNQTGTPLRNVPPQPGFLAGPKRFMPAAKPADVKPAAGAGILGNLDRIQQILNVVERAAPMIEEYGPMVKNLPKMYRMMKAFKEIEQEDEQVKVQEEKQNPAGNSEQKKSAEPVENVDVKSEKPKKGISSPKLFI